MTRGDTQKVEKARSPRKTRKQPEGHIPRPQNSFFLFRQKFNQDTGDCNQAKVSADCSVAWRALSQEEKEYWAKKAEEEKEEHRRKYPDYKYIRRMPAKRTVKEAQVAKGNETYRAGSDERDLSSNGATSVNDPVLCPVNDGFPGPIDATFSLTPTPALPFTVEQYIPQATWVPVPTYHVQPQPYNQLNDFQQFMNPQDDPYSQQYLYAWQNSMDDGLPQSDPAPIATIDPQWLINDATPYYH